MKGVNLVAILGSSILTAPGLYRYTDVPTSDLDLIDLEGLPHYVGHPTTKGIIEKLGGTPATSKYFDGLNVGESYIAFSLKSSRGPKGWSEDQSDITMDDFVLKLITRIE